MTAEACYRCGAPATLLCDFVLGLEKGGTVPARKVNGRYYPAHDVTSIHTSRIFTCDRPMCEGCATNKGVSFYDGSPEMTDIVTHDYCRDHAGADDMRAPVVTEEQADATRNRMRLGVFSPEAQT